MRIRLFGGLEIASSQGEAFRFSTRKASLLFAVLVLAGRRSLRREMLSELLWPGRDETQARNSLRQALAAIRRSFRTDSDRVFEIITGQDSVALVADPDAADIWTFERKIAEGDGSALASAAELYRGDVLAGEKMPDGLDEWIGPYRNRYQRQALDLVEKLSLPSGVSGTNEEMACERLAERLLASDPSLEPAHRALMRIYVLRGHENAALRQFEMCREALRRNLDTEPEAQTSALAASLRLRERDGNQEIGSEQAYRLQAQGFRAPVRRQDQPSLAVMPFDNLGGKDDEYFVDGVVEEITAALSRVRDFFVIARQSAFTYKGRFVDVREIGRELGVNYVVEGTVRRGGDRLRISVQLVDADTRAQLWSERYEGSIEHVFEFQDRISAQVAGAIHPAIRGAEIELAERRPPASLRAYDLVMRAYPNLWGRRRDANNQAIELLKQAIAVDPTYARAHALLSWCYASSASYLWTEQPERDLGSALASVAAAGTIADDPTALTAAGAALSMCGEQERAIAFVERALTLDPNNAWAWTRLGWITIYRGDAAGAPDCFERAMTLSPMDPLAFNMKLGKATALAMTGSLSEAIAIAREVMARHPDISMSYRYLAAWTAMNGDLDSARWAAEKLIANQPGFTIARYRSLPFFRYLPEWADRVAAALKLAGLPER